MAPDEDTVCESNRSRPIHGVSQQVNFTSLVDDDARRGRRQPGAPFAGENLGVAKNPSLQSDASRIVMARWRPMPPRPALVAWRQISAP